MKKIAVYTAIFNNYDWLKEPIVPSKDVDYVCFTDNEGLISEHWRIVQIKESELSPSLLNRKIKLLYPFTYFKDYDYSLYVDGSVMMKGDVGRFLQKYIEREPLLMNFKHPNNDCIFEEMNRCIKQGRGNAGKLRQQYEDYKASGMPEHFGMSDNKIILRMRCKEVQLLMEEWYRHVCDYSGRDQVCLSYVLWQHGLNYHFFDEIIEQNEFFETWPHNNAPYYMIWWRKMKWFSERTGFGKGFFAFLNNKVKPFYLKRRAKGKV